MGYKNICLSIPPAYPKKCEKDLICLLEKIQGQDVGKQRNHQLPEFSFTTEFKIHDNLNFHLQLFTLEIRKYKFN